MTLSVDLYWSFRSPYSYLATPRLRAMAQTFDLDINLRPVYPLAIRTPDFFGDLDPLWVPYLIRDTFRIAEREHLPYGTFPTASLAEVSVFDCNALTEIKIPVKVEYYFQVTRQKRKRIRHGESK